MFLDSDGMGCQIDFLRKIGDELPGHNWDLGRFDRRNQSEIPLYDELSLWIAAGLNRRFGSWSNAHTELNAP